MNRAGFEKLRDLAEKRISADISFVRKKSTSPLLVAEGVPIENAENAPLFMSIQYNPEVGSKTINVHAAGVGAICRLDIDGHNHRPHGRCHKHSLQSERCLLRNLPHAEPMEGLSGMPLLVVFKIFCEMAKIVHEGTFEAVDSTDELP